MFGSMSDSASAQHFAELEHADWRKELRRNRQFGRRLVILDALARRGAQPLQKRLASETAWRGWLREQDEFSAEAAFEALTAQFGPMDQLEAVTDRMLLLDALWIAYGRGQQVWGDAILRRLIALPRSVIAREHRKSLKRANAAFKFDQRLLQPHRKRAPAPRRAGDAPIRIAYVLHNALPLSTGGYAVRADGVARGLMALGAQVDIVTRPGYPGDIERAAGTTPEVETIDGVTYHHIAEPTPYQDGGVSSAYMVKAVDPLARKLEALAPDVVMGASNFMTARPALAAARRLGLPFVYEVRGFWEITWLSRDPSYAEQRRFWFHRAAETATAQQSDLVFTLTQSMSVELQRRGVPERLIRVAPNSVNPEAFAKCERDEPLAQYLGLPKGAPVIGYIGTFVGYEGLDVLAEACARLQARGGDFRLLLVGSEKVSSAKLGSIASHLREIAEEGGFADRLIMPGRVPFKDVVRYYSLIDIAVFPRRSLPVTEIVSPIKPFEAMAMHKPIVVSSVGALAEIVRDGETGRIFEKDDPAALAEVLAELIESPETRAQLGDAARSWVEAHRSWSRTTQSMLREIEALLERQRGAPHAEASPTDALGAQKP